MTQLLMQAPYLALSQPALAEHGLVLLIAFALILGGARLLFRPRRYASMQAPPVKSRARQVVRMEFLLPPPLPIRPQPTPSKTVKVPEQAGRICLRKQWQRTTDIVEEALQNAQDINNCQASARQQLDAAEHAINLLLDEIGYVMTIPGELTTPAALQSPEHTAQGRSAQSIAA